MEQRANRFERVVLVGDSYGLPMLLDALEPKIVCCLIPAQIRQNDLAKVENLASQYDIPLLIQPRSGTDEYPAFVDALRKLMPDILVCNSYSMIIRPDILNLVSGNAINVHAALLPKNRGPNPIQWAIIKDESETGVTLHYMDETIDAGDIISQAKMAIHEDDTWVSLRDRLSVVTRELLAKQLPLVLLGTNGRQKQDEASASINSRLTPESPKIEFDKMDDRKIFNLIRAQVHPLRGAYVESERGREYFSSYLPLASIPELRRHFEQPIQKMGSTKPI